MRSADGRTRAKVLVVESDGETRERLSAWLEAAGHEIVACAGPGAPGYSCPGSRGERCPIADDADVAVVDLRLAGDIARRGTRGWRLCQYYLNRGKKIAVLVGDEDEMVPYPDEDVALLRRPAERPWVLAGVQALVGHTTLVAPFDQTAVASRRRGEPDGHDPAR